MEAVDSDTNDSSELDEEDNGEHNTGNSSDEDGDDGPVSPCHIDDLTSQIKWDHEEMQAGFADESAPVPHNGPSGSHPGVNRRCNDPFKCLQDCGLSYSFLAWLAASSNE